MFKGHKFEPLISKKEKKEARLSRLPNDIIATVTVSVGEVTVKVHSTQQVH